RPASAWAAYSPPKPPPTTATCGRLATSGAAAGDGPGPSPGRPPLCFGVLAHEGSHALPGVGRGFRELRLLAVEEAVRRTRVDGGVVLDIRLTACGLELVDRALRNARVGATEEREHRAFVARHGVDGLGAIGPAAEAERPAVEADDARVAEPARRLQVR